VIQEWALLGSVILKLITFNIEETMSGRNSGFGLPERGKPSPFSELGGVNHAEWTF
jgi:hypothetical protein